jgi:hypothetical protein
MPSRCDARRVGQRPAICPDRSSPPPHDSRPRAIAIVALAGLWSCAAPAAPLTPVRDPSSTTELGMFMNRQLNPAFSKISFLLFQDDDREREVDPSALPASASDLARAADGLAGWPELPGESEQSKLVFHAYVDSLKADADKLVEALGGNQLDDARQLFESLRRKCDACHHFFRHDQSPVIGPRGARGPRP